jgi:hypothetical protein
VEREFGTIPGGEIVPGIEPDVVHPETPSMSKADTAIASSVDSARPAMLRGFHL